VEPFADASFVAALRHAWEQAADDLDIRVATAGAAVLDPSGKAHALVAVIPDFGGRMHIFERYKALLAGVIWERGQGFTVLGGGYERYERGTFVEALCDWGWTGQGPVPSWYREPAEGE
jgi:hypothetical protein